MSEVTQNMENSDLTQEQTLIGDKMSPNEDTQPAISKWETQAKDMGWKPKTEFHGQEDDFVDAKEYVQRQSFIDHINKLNRRVKDQQSAIDTLAQHNKKIAEMSYNQALAELTDRQKQAIATGNIQVAQQTSDELVKLKTEGKPDLHIPSSAEASAKEFVEKHKSWFNRDNPENAAMQSFAIALDEELIRAQPNMSAEERLETVEQRIKDQYPSRFERKLSTAVISQSAKPLADHDKTYNDLPAFHKNVIKQLKTSYPNDKNLINKYIADLKKLGEI
jgi:hypothetical protein